VADTYRYKAFVSYRHVERDRKWAQWLMERLEAFRPPRALEHDGESHLLGRLFRDDDEIPASSDLSHTIQDALKSSEFLIVVCSPDTPASKWVRSEIDYFRSLGHGDRILALLVDGEPEDSFPPSLLHVLQERIAADGTKLSNLVDVEPIAADIRPRPHEKYTVTKRRALLRIAAGLLGVSYDNLARREHRRRVRRRWVWGSALALLAVAALTIYGTVLFASSERAEEAWVVHTYQTMDALRSTYSTVMDIETGGLGYILTRKPAFLEPYRMGVARLQRDLDRFENLTRDDPEQQARARALRKLTNDSIGVLNRSLGMPPSSDASGQKAGQDLIDQYKTMTDAFRMSVALGMEQEKRLLEVRIEFRRTVERDEIFGALLSIAVSLLVLLGVGAMAISRSEWI
jgi:CHASE3 domain sensor protein